MTPVQFARTQRASRRMIFLRDKYLAAFPNEPPPVDPARVAVWAYEQGLWKPIETDPREILRRKLCRAFRHEFITDPQGREVTANYSVVEEVMTSDGPKRRSRWYPTFKAPPEVARQHFSLERRQMSFTIQQLTLDLQSYNENNEFGAVLPPLDLDFSKDREEMDLPSEYRPELDDLDEEEDD